MWWETVKERNGSINANKTYKAIYYSVNPDFYMAESLVFMLSYAEWHTEQKSVPKSGWFHWDVHNWKAGRCHQG